MSYSLVGWVSSIGRGVRCGVLFRFIGGRFRFFELGVFGGRGAGVWVVYDFFYCELIFRRG